MPSSDDEDDFLAAAASAAAAGKGKSTASPNVPRPLPQKSNSAKSQDGSEGSPLKPGERFKQVARRLSITQRGLGLGPQSAAGMKKPDLKAAFKKLKDVGGPFHTTGNSAGEDSGHGAGGKLRRQPSLVDVLDYSDLVDEGGQLTGTRQGQLAMFERRDFDAERFTGTALTFMSEKGVKELCDELKALKQSSEEELKSRVHSNYEAFIRASKELAELDSKLAVVRDLINASAPPVQAIIKGAGPEGLAELARREGGGGGAFPPPALAASHPQLVEMQGLPGAIDVLLAERKAREVMAAITRGENLVAEHERRREERAAPRAGGRAGPAAGAGGAPAASVDASGEAAGGSQGKKQAMRQRRPSLVRRSSLKSYQELNIPDEEDRDTERPDPRDSSGSAGGGGGAAEKRDAASKSLRLRRRASFTSFDDADGPEDPQGGGDPVETRAAGAGAGAGAGVGRGKEGGAAVPPAEVEALRAALRERRGMLVELLTELVREGGPGALESAELLCALGSPQRAFKLLRERHSRELERAVRGLRGRGATMDGVVYTGALCHGVFTAIAAAARESLAVAGDSYERTSALVIWALRETEHCAVLVKQQVLGPAASQGNLRMVADSIRVAVAHCESLQELGLSLAPAMRSQLIPHVETAMEAQAKRLEEEAALLVSEEVAEVAGGGKKAYTRLMSRNMSTRDRGGSAGGEGTATTPTGSDARSIRRMSVGSVESPLAMPPPRRKEVERLCRSARRIYLLVHKLVRDVAPFATPRLLERTGGCVAGIFGEYHAQLRRAMRPAVARAGQRGATKGLAEHERPALRILASVTELARMLPELLEHGVAEVATGGGDEAPVALARQREAQRRQMAREMGRGTESLREVFASYRAQVLVCGPDAPLRLNPGDYTAAAAVASQPSPATAVGEMEPSVGLLAAPGMLMQAVATAEDLLPGGRAEAKALVGQIAEGIVHAYGAEGGFWLAVGAAGGVPSRAGRGGRAEMVAIAAPSPAEGGGAVLTERGLAQLALDMHFLRAAAAEVCTTGRTFLPAVRRLVDHAANAYAGRTGGDGRKAVASPNIQARAESLAAQFLM